MSSSSVQDVRSQYFSQDWSITIPSRPNVKYTRVIPARFDEMIPLITNVENNEHQDSKDKIWDEAAIKEQLANLATRYEEGSSKQGSIETFVELDGKVVGFAGLWVSKDGKRGDIGVVLNKEGRGKGLGKLTVRCVEANMWNLRSLLIEGKCVGSGILSAGTSSDPGDDESQWADERGDEEFGCRGSRTYY